MKKFIVVIPARYASTRLPAKPLMDIAGKPMVQWVYEQSVKSGAERVIVATDDRRIFDAVDSFGCEVCLTSKDHQSGTERLSEVVEKYRIASDEIIVNVQGDEPLIPLSVIRQVVKNLTTFVAPMATLAVNIDNVDEVFNPNVVKVVTDKDGYAMYFSRATLPWNCNNFAKIPMESYSNLKRHIGIYAYRAGFIKAYINWLPSPIEYIECLEQLRVLWYGEKIHVDMAIEVPPKGVDTLEDLDLVRRLVQEL
ncbi:3-deoxy-manno-octulosonate cytidylyltransferase [Candidatus Enterovibrio escicola]|uniref:3-deoxy-manno-octulosonate cytidylyltransferase n=1 Tax=Candidatus Enterovibrio escicola TaxID=1927127 RepID=UPI001237DD90|nr:3-deoxy-manno-octulosonate cytidylyltransferase [Candidatus Enterovibrio escacola]